jgi:hypothetical protein
VSVSLTHLGDPRNHLPVVLFPSIPWSPLARTAGLEDGVPAIIIRIIKHYKTIRKMKNRSNNCVTGKNSVILHSTSLNHIETFQNVQFR